MLTKNQILKMISINKKRMETILNENGYKQTTGLDKVEFVELNQDFSFVYELTYNDFEDQTLVYLNIANDSIEVSFWGEINEQFRIISS